VPNFAERSTVTVELAFLSRPIVIALEQESTVAELGSVTESAVGPRELLLEVEEPPPQAEKIKATPITQELKIHFERTLRSFPTVFKTAYGLAY